MHHLLAYQANVTAAASPVTLAGLVDPVIPRSQTSSLYLLPTRMNLLAASYMGANSVRAQISSPTLRQINQPYIRPNILALRPQDNSKVQEYFDRPLPLPALEEIGILATATGVGEIETALLWVSTGIDPIPAGPPFVCRATSTTAAVANTWTILTYTMETALPAGNYALINSEHISATAICHRWAFFGQLLRPGALSHQANSDRQDRIFGQHMLGNYGNFLNTSMPQLEVLCTAADASHEIYLQVVPINVPLNVFQQP